MNMYQTPIMSEKCRNRVEYLGGTVEGEMVKNHKPTIILRGGGFSAKERVETAKILLTKGGAITVLFTGSPSDRGRLYSFDDFIG